jgi:hypothetical protein
VPAVLFNETVSECDGISLEHTEELCVRSGRPIRFPVGRRAVELHFRPEGLVDHARSERARVGGAGHEFPERIEVFDTARSGLK